MFSRSHNESCWNFLLYILNAILGIRCSKLLALNATKRARAKLYNNPLCLTIVALTLRELDSMERLPGELQRECKYMSVRKDVNL